jgi:hypothetical protein
MQSNTNIILGIESINPDEYHEVTYKGINIFYKNKYYIITVYHGLPVKYVKINNMTFDFILSKWNDLVIIPITIIHNTVNIFKHFIKKQLDVNEKLLLGNITLKFVGNIFKPIHNIPGNPNITYNVLEYNNIISNNIIDGEPVCSETNGLYGIVSSCSNTNLYLIPSIYILMTLDKINNMNNIIYTINENINNIYKIDNYKVICNKIYCNIHKMYIPFDNYIVFHSNKDSKLKITTNINTDKLIKPVEFINPYISLNNNIIRRGNYIELTSGLMHLFKLLNETDFLERLFSLLTNENNIQYKNYYIHTNKYKLS